MSRSGSAITCNRRETGENEAAITGSCSRSRKEVPDKIMSGPALRQFSSHNAIHEASHEEAMVILASLRRLVKDHKNDLAYQAADVFVEHFDTKVLRHAEAEESGLYDEVEASQPNLKPVVAELRREHDAMRALLGTIQSRLAADRVVDNDMLGLMTALTSCNAFHSHHEETALIALLEADKR